jgi:hemoglobin
MEENSLFEQLGGRPTLERVHKVFYDKIYAHPWLKIFFLERDQELLENQQTDFMTANMGGGKIYFGKLPKPTHKHMFISEELFDLRNEILRESMEICRVPKNLAEHWLKIDYAFKHSLVKKDIGECEKRYFTDEIIIAPKPKTI